MNKVLFAAKNCKKIWGEPKYGESQNQKIFKFFDFGSQNCEFWCILGVLVSPTTSFFYSQNQCNLAPPHIFLQFFAAKRTLFIFFHFGVGIAPSPRPTSLGASIRFSRLPPHWFCPGASKGTPGDANCVTKTVGGDKIRAQGGTVYIFMCEKEKFSVQCICQSFSDTIT